MTPLLRRPTHRHVHAALAPLLALSVLATACSSADLTAEPSPAPRGRVLPYEDVDDARERDFGTTPPASPASAALSTDLDDPVTRELCRARVRSQPIGYARASAGLPVDGAKEVTARLEGRTLHLDFRWPGETVDATRTDFVTTLTFEATETLGLGRQEVRVFDDGVATRTCSATSAATKAGTRELFAESAVLVIDEVARDGIGGHAEIGAARIDFYGLLQKDMFDEARCCLDSYPIAYPEARPLSREEKAALCAARDVRYGTFHADEGSGVERAVDVTVRERAHPLRRTLEVSFHGAITTGADAAGNRFENKHWMSWRFGDTMGSPVAPRLQPGRYEGGLQAVGGSECHARGGRGWGSSAFYDESASLVITRREGDQIEGRIELERVDGPKTITFSALVDGPGPDTGPDALCCVE